MEHLSSVHRSACDSYMKDIDNQLDQLTTEGLEMACSQDLKTLDSGK